jgi:hypothetical protein
MKQLCGPSQPIGKRGLSDAYVIDPKAVLFGAVAFQCLQRIAWRAEIVQRPGGVKLKQFSNRNLFDGLKRPRSDSKK